MIMVWIVAICCAIAVKGHGKGVPPPVLTSLSVSSEGMASVSSNPAPRVGTPTAIQWAGGVTNGVELKTRSVADYPMPALPKATGPSGRMTRDYGDKRPFYRVKVWNDLLGDYVEFCAYAPGNTGFFQAELVTE